MEYEESEPSLSHFGTLAEESIPTAIIGDGPPSSTSAQPTELEPTTSSPPPVTEPAAPTIARVVEPTPPALTSAPPSVTAPAAGATVSIPPSEPEQEAEEEEMPAGFGSLERAEPADLTLSEPKPSAQSVPQQDEAGGRTLGRRAMAKQAQLRQLEADRSAPVEPAEQAPKPARRMKLFDL